MNRKFKFRVWDKVDKEFKAFMDGDFVSGQIYTPHPSEEFVIQQWTGLLDKNEVEIYEGDIISFGSTDIDDLFEVVWENTESRFVLESNGGLGCWLLDVCDREIIGNIFENPELI
jgi:uncharacterized phage protein (TIGR01671 family)